MKNTILKTIILTTIIIQGCKTKDTIEQRSFPEKNIASHIFKQNINTLKDTIVSLFNFDNQDNDKYLSKIFYFYMSDDNHNEDNKMFINFSVETNKDTLFSKDYFKLPNTSNDIYVHCFGECWYSKLYYSNGKPLEYRTPFIIKLDSIDLATTKVSIIAERPLVINGIEGYGPHGPVARETQVETSTIEEYTLLLFIAEILKENNLIPLKLPETN